MSKEPSDCAKTVLIKNHLQMLINKGFRGDFFMLKMI